MKDDLKYWLALTYVKDVGPITAKRLLSIFPSPEKIFKASYRELKDIEDIGEIRAKRICEFNEWKKIDEEIERVKEHNVSIIRYTERFYPETLRLIDDSPIILYTRGDFKEEDRYALAIVGSRIMTDYGRRTAEKIAFELASCGLTIVSGMARGIDTVSHMGALKAGGRSIAVLGCGLDIAYPPENKRLLETLSNSGCVISEFPLGTPPNKENFPQRNRLISGLSMGVLVVEAAINSGSLITANHALEQGKEVFAIPGNILSKSYEGTNYLIKKGARLVQRFEDILEDLSPQLKSLLQKDRLKEIQDALSLNKLEINEEERSICNILGQETKHIDLIARELKMPTQRALNLLLGLEIRGIVKQLDGKRFYI